MFKTELNHLVELGALVPKTESEGDLSSYIVSKKDGHVCRISDLCQLNKVVKGRQYLLPIITDILHKHSGSKFFTKLDICMQYYTFKLEEHNHDLCTIITPFQKYKYLMLPMGLKCFLDITPSIMEVYKLASIMLMCTLMMLVLSPQIGITTSSCSALYYVVYKNMASPLTHLIVNG
ncbi:hypothetical protein ACHAW6_015523 [Cyclotella cf. meneghiniana]